MLKRREGVLFFFFETSGAMSLISCRTDEKAWGGSAQNREDAMTQPGKRLLLILLPFCSLKATGYPFVCLCSNTRVYYTCRDQQV